MKKIGIIGLGLIGGSLAKALVKRCDVKTIVALGRNIEPLEQAVIDGTITSYTTEVDESFSSCDIIFICTPVNRICDYITKLLPFIDENTIITDVGSTKLEIYKKMCEFSHINFIGGHPMAGSEKIGYAASLEYLLENAFYILTPLEHVSQEKIDLLKSVIEKIGAVPIIISPSCHDYSVAAISHVPHVIAAALVNMVENLDDSNKTMQTLAAGGFKDITRIASSSPVMWQSICMENKNQILNILDDFSRNINEFKNILFKEKEEDIFDFFTRAKNYRDGFTKKITGGYLKTYELFVDIMDKPGSIATIATLLSVNNINIKNIGIINNREYEDGILQVIFDTKDNLDKSVKLIGEMNFKYFY